MSKITLLGLAVMVVTMVLITLPGELESKAIIGKRSAEPQDNRFFFGNNNSGGRRPPPRRAPPRRGRPPPPGRPGGRPGGFGGQQSEQGLDPLFFGGAALAGAAVGAGAATLLG